MGYILPITHFQADQYAIRDIVSKAKNYKKEEIYPVAKIANFSANLEMKHPSQTSYQEKHMHEEQAANEKLMAQLTGIGTYFHAQI